ARDALELGDAQLERIANHAALGAAKGNVHHRALPRHPRGERFHFIAIDVRIESNPSLGRTTRRVVQHAIAGEHLDLPVVHEDGDRQRDLFFGVAEDLVEARFQIEQLGCPVEPRHHVLERVVLVQEAVLIGPDDLVGRESEIGCHEFGKDGWPNAGGRTPGWSRRASSSEARRESTVLCPDSSANCWETYHNDGAARGQSGASFTASLSVHRTRRVSPAPRWTAVTSSSVNR